MNTEFVDGNGQTNFTGLRAEEVELGEYIHFEGDGTPAAYIHYDAASKNLTLTFYDTNMALPATSFNSKFVTDASVQTIENGVRLTLNTTGIWGYDIEYENGRTKLFLKRVPTVSSTPGRPLEGVHIMLDPGHGEGNTTGYGAVGIAGEDGYPHEHHINYALAEAIGYRLQQLGATVTLTRDQNSTTIDERYVLQNTLKPDFFISVHHDGLDGNQDLGQINKIFGIYYHPYDIPSSKQFAQNLMASVGATTGRALEETPRWGGVNYGVIRTTVCPSVLFEYGLIVNPQQYYEATSTDGLYAAAVGTADGILATLQQAGGNIAPQTQSAPQTDAAAGGETQPAAVAVLPPIQMSFTHAPAKRCKLS
jgi:N-acetylmuramoyl-L-alanine amidase